MRRGKEAPASVTTHAFKVNIESAELVSSERSGGCLINDAMAEKASPPGLPCYLRYNVLWACLSLP